MPESLEINPKNKLTLSKDLEGDKDMSPATESSHGEGESDTMFPAASDTAAMSNTHAKLADQRTADGELSPPYSQDPPDVTEDEAMDLSGGEPAWEMSSNAPIYKLDGNSDGATQDFTAKTGEMYKPGAWDTVKTREEYQRQWNGLLDKNFSLSEEASSKYFAVVTET